MAKKVDKVEGYSLVSDTEIARLADVDNYDDEEVRGLIGDNAQAIEDLEAYVGTIPTDEKYADITNVISYVNKKAEETLAAAQGGSSETAASVKQQLDNYKSENDTRVKAAEDAIDALETESAKHALKTEVEAEFAKYNTTEAQKAIDDEQDRRIKAIEDDYLVEADIANFETKENVQKVADDLAAYVESNDAALAAETKARTDADAGFETRIAALEGNFGDGEGTVEAQIAAAVKAEEDARKEAVQGVQGSVDAVAGRVTTLETESAKHALKTEVEAVDAKFADYTKTADLPTDLGDFTNNAGYAKTADVNTELDKKADKTQVATDIANAIAPLATTEALNGVKATAEAATTVEEVDAQIDAKITALNLGTTYEPIGAETRAKAYADGLISDANLAQYTTEQEVKDIVDEVIAGAVDGDTITGLANLVEYLNTHGTEAKEMGAAIDVLEGKVETIEGKPAYGITATQISNWDNEVGAKALAETKTTTAEVKTQIEEYGYATTGYADGKASAAQAAAEATAAAALATAVENVKTDASNKDAVILAEAQAYADQAEADAISAAKTETENQIKALTEGAVADNASDIADIMEMLTWGSF